MPIFRATVVIANGNGLPEDAMTNTFHFQINPPQDPALQRPILTAALRDFYTQAHVSGGFANYYSWDLATVQWYNLADPPPRVPVTLDLGLVSPVETASFVPAEVSIVASFQGVRISGVPQARRRGRVYLGGWSTPFTASTGGAPPRIEPGVITEVNTAAEGLRDDSATASCPWVVWSPTDDDAVEVTNGWCDNAPDTQRRRGQAATIRQIWS